MPRVNPAILAWARETAGLSLESAARKLAIRDARGVPGANRLAQIESGAVEPTRPLLVRMAKQYRRPLLTFYLASPPVEANRGEDFRTLSEGYDASDEPILDALLRDVRARQGLVRAALEDDDDIVPATWIGSIAIGQGAENALAAIAPWLGLDLAEYRAQDSPDEAFRLLRNTVESRGVFVLLVGDLGSHHTSIDVRTYRGFALADEIAPFIVINDHDSRAAWAFTLLHELTHLWLGQTGVSGSNGSNTAERFCNDVASRYLLRDSELRLLEVANWDDLERAASAITAFAHSIRVSSSLVAYRLYRGGTIDARTWRRLADFYREQWQDRRAEIRSAARTKGGGPDWYVVRQHRLGQSLLGTVSRMMRTGALTTAKAGQVLGVRPTQVQQLMRVFYGS